LNASQVARIWVILSKRYRARVCFSIGFWGGTDRMDRYRSISIGNCAGGSENCTGKADEHWHIGRIGLRRSPSRSATERDHISSTCTLHSLNLCGASSGGWSRARIFSSVPSSQCPYTSARTSFRRSDRSRSPLLPFREKGLGFALVPLDRHAPHVLGYYLETRRCESISMAS